jgi:hypothetical protein
MGEKFEIAIVYEGCFRIIHDKTRTWFLVKLKDLEEVKVFALKYIKNIFKNGIPKFSPSYGQKYKITGLYYDYNNARFKNTDGLSFIVGSHYQNTSGTGYVHAKPGEIITFDRESEDDAWWFFNNSGKYTVKGNKPWSLLWASEIVQVK